MSTLSKINETHPRWSQLSPEQRKYVGNGCGSKGGFLQPPNFLFAASCDQHDFYYWRGCNSADRLAADLAFLRAMRRDAAASAWWVRWFHYSLAWTYYKAVRLRGGGAFTYLSGPKTWDDLTENMEVWARNNEYREKLR